jgi:hypothetical protein
VQTHASYDFFRVVLKDTIEHVDSCPIARGVLVSGQPCVAAGINDTAGFGITGTESGIHRAPIITSAVASNGAGTLTPSSTYLYVAVYKWEDTNGDVHRSAPSAPVSVALGASDDTVTLAIATIDWERKFCADEGTIEVYRSEAGQTALRKLVDLYNASAASGAGSSDYVVGYTDVTPDASIEDNAVIYTQASQIANDMAPACRWLRASETRVWAAGLWDPRLVQASKILVPGEPVQWSSLDTFKVVLPRPCTGLAFQDGTLLAFAETDVYAITASGGPGNDGLTPFSEARLICPGVGCQDPPSIRETPAGVIFRSRRGFEILSRGGAVQALPGVEDTLASYPNIIASALRVDDSATTAHFIARNAAGNATVVLVFDVDRQAWSVDTFPIVLRNIGTAKDGELLYASSDTSASPAFLLDDETVNADNGTAFESRLRLHDIHPANPGGWTHVEALVARCIRTVNPSTANLSLGLDDGTPNTGGVSSTTTGQQAFVQIGPGDRSNQASCVQIEAYDSVGGVTWCGFTLYHNPEHDNQRPPPAAEVIS